MSILEKDLRHVVAGNVASARAARGLTQGELADAAGVVRATVIQIESGEADTKLSTLGNLAAALDTSAMILLMGEHELAALRDMLRQPERVEEILHSFAEGGVEPVAHLPRAAKKAGKTGEAVAIAAGLGAAASVGAAIGTLAIPGIGTAIGAALGVLVDRARHRGDDPKSKRK